METVLLPKYYENSPVLPQNFSTALQIPDPTAEPGLTPPDCSGLVNEAFLAE